MKNLMNRVLVVLTVSAVFAGSINAMPKGKGKTAAKATTTMSSGVIAFRNLMYKGGANFNKYPVADRKSDIATLKTEMPGAKDAVATLGKEVLIEDNTKRQASFNMGGVARKAIAAIELAMMNGNLKDAVADLRENPTAENAKIVAAIQVESAAAIADLDETTTGWKSYMTQRNALLATIGLAAVGTAYYFGVPGIAMNKASEAYEYAKTTRAGKLAGEAATTVSGYIRPVGSKLYGWGASAAGAIGATAAKNALMSRIYGAEKEVQDATNELNEVKKEVVSQ